jgi:hypothetical protein
MGNFLKITVAAALAGASFSTLAVDDAYKAARDQANNTYKMDRKGCKGFSGKEREDCLHQAKSKHDQAIIEAKKLKTHGAYLHGDASQAPTSYSKLPASGDATASQGRTAGNQPGQFMGNAPGSANGTTNAAK